MKNSSRTQRYKDLKRNEILSAAEAVFASKGFENATIEEIAREGDFATGTIYLYFKNKEDLYATFFEIKARGYLDFARKKVAEVKRREDKLPTLVRATMDYIAMHSAFFKIYIGERDRLGWQMRDKIREGVARTYGEMSALFEHVVAEAVRAKVIKRAAPRKIAIVLMGLLDAVVHEGLLSDFKMDVRSAERFVLDVFLGGVGSRRGRNT
jgi:TetR/AcrR family fatty acid metabolism transcriptional regulator